MSLEEVTIGQCRLIHGDALEVLPTLGRLEAVVTDPPYGIQYRPRTITRPDAKQYAGGTYRTHFPPMVGDAGGFDPTPWLQVPCILWGANNYSQHLPSGGGWLVWHKAVGIQGFYSMSECELAYCSTTRAISLFRHLWHGFKRASEVGEKVRHPTQKPVALMQWCLGFVPPTLAITDPYMGSGTTGIACLRGGRPFCGIEVERQHFDHACRRIEQAYAQPDLFLPSAAAPPAQQLSLA